MGAIHFEAGVDGTKIHQDIKRIEQDLKGLSDAAVKESGRMDAAFRKAAAAIGTLFTVAAGKQFISQMVSVRGEFQQLNISLETILGNKEKADQLFRDVVDFAAYTPFELTEVGQGVKKLLAFNVEAEDTLDILRRLGDISAGLSTDLDGLVQAYGKVKAKGKLQAEEMNLFLERGIPLVSELAEMYGVAESAIYEMASKGMVSFEDLHQVLVNLTDDGGKFADLMQKQVESLPGQISNLKDAISQMLNEMGQANEGILYGSIDFVKKLVENYEEVLAVLKALIATYGAYRAAIIVNTMVQQAQAAGSLAKALKGAAVAQRALNLAQKASPIGLALAAVTGLVTAMVALSKRTREAADQAERFKNEYEGIEDSVRANYTGQLADLEQLRRKLEEVKGTREDEQEILNTLNEKYGAHLENLLNEKDAYNDLKKAIDQVVGSIKEQIKMEALREKAKVIQGRIIDVDQNIEKFIGPYTEGGIPEDLKGELNKTADQALKDLYGAKNVHRKIAFKYLRQLLQEDKKAYEEEFNRIMDEIGKITAEAAERVTPDPAKTDQSPLAKQIREAEQAYKALAQLRRTGLEEGTDSFFEKFLQDGSNFEEWLRTLREKYKGHTEELVVINSALASLVLEEMEKVEEARLGLSSTMTDQYRKALDDLNRSMDQYFKDLEDQVVESVSSEDFDPASKIVQAFGKTMTEEELQKLQNEMDGFAGILRDLSGTVSQFDQMAGQSLNVMSQMVQSLSSFSSGNITSVYSSIISIASAIAEFAMAQEALKDQYKAGVIAKQAERIERSVAAINQHLDEQYYLLSQLEGIDWLRGAYDTVEETNRAIENMIATFRGADLRFEALKDPVGGDPNNPADHFKVKIEPDWDEDDFRELLEKYGDALTDESEAELRNFLDGLDQARRDADELLQEIRRETVGFDVQYLTDSVMEMFEAMKDGAADFGQTFEQIMQEAVLNSFQQRVVTSQMQQFYDQLYEAMESPVRSGEKRVDLGESSGTLTEAEFAALETTWDGMMEQLSGQYSSLMDFLNQVGAGLNDPDNDPNSLTGAIRRGITEDTGSLLAGRMNTIMLDVRANTLNTAALVNHSVAIEHNTALTAQRLASMSKMAGDISRIRKELVGGGGGGGGR